MGPWGFPDRRGGGRGPGGDPMEPTAGKERPKREALSPVRRARTCCGGARRHTKQSKLDIERID